MIILLAFMFMLDFTQFSVSKGEESRKILTNVKNYFIVIESEF